MADPTCAIETITPAIAAELLERNVNNRKLTRSKVETYVGAMQRGEWMLNGETVKVGVDGKLLDGQHRLRAIVIHGKPQRSFVARGLDPACFKCIDIGKNRTPSDILSIRGVKYHTACSAAARLLFVYLNGHWTKTGARAREMTHSEMLALLDEHAGLVHDSVQAMARDHLCSFIPQSQQVWAYYVFRRVDEDLGAEFLTGISDRHKETGRSSPALLRERLEKTAQAEQRPSPVQKLSWLITAWNSYHSGLRIDRLEMMRGRGLPRVQPCPFGMGVTS